MGERVFNPATGRFDQTDPVSGGSANSYDYAAQNPLTNSDLTGCFCSSWMLRLNWISPASSWTRDNKENIIAGIAMSFPKLVTLGIDNENFYSQTRLVIFLEERLCSDFFWHFEVRIVDEIQSRVRSQVTWNSYVLYTNFTAWETDFSWTAVGTWWQLYPAF